ncbi:hypothetical protein SAMN04487936_11553 [Halobacillus dabanensis]|uniref:Uncharacterized protein n=1 Tax=Halobacillus dabanensis TaxID=240302 RepID=A0A1I3ZZE2_HALDA|nr:hypothetical protein [Halobacillus dabanensis]SFK49071.1 hypothetical protein SAMN04487936_11553 [Halobacillus dabanensis]
MAKYFNEDWEKVRDEFYSVKEVFACFDRRDAMLKGYYETEDVPNNHTLEKITIVPRLVVKNEDGNEFWSDHHNSGYGGHGASATVRLLKSVGVYLEGTIKQNSQIYYNVANDELKVSGTKFEVIEQNKYNDLPAVDYYCNPNKNIVAIPKIMDSSDSTLEQLEDFTAFYSRSMLEEIDAVYLYLKDNQAIRKGNYLVAESESSQYKKIYPICILGKNGHELWPEVEEGIDKHNPFASYEVESILSAINFTYFEEQKKNFLERLKEAFTSHNPLTLKLTKVNGRVHIEKIDITKTYI